MKQDLNVSVILWQNREMIFIESKNCGRYCMGRYVRYVPYNQTVGTIMTQL